MIRYFKEWILEKTQKKRWLADIRKLAQGTSFQYMTIYVDDMHQRREQYGFSNDNNLF